MRKNTININGKDLNTLDLELAASNPNTTIEVDSNSIDRIKKSRELLDKFVQEGRIIYGVNTSLGGFVSWLIPIEQAQTLQENLINAVATNVGKYLSDTEVRAGMLARINSLANGASAISIENFNKLVSIFNAGIIPCVPSKGSLGASGDLGPLAAIALVAIGKWKAKYKGEILSGQEALKKAGISPMKLGFKEGLCLINGTSIMAGMAALLVEKTTRLLQSYDVITALSFEGLAVKKKPFHPAVHEQKPHKGQLQTAKNITNLLSDSKMAVNELEIEKILQGYKAQKPVSTETPIEDSYAIRCTPHVIGPVKDSLKWIQSNVNNELNSSNDNPLVLPEHNEIFHNGHFHGQYIAMSMDHLSIALTTLSNLSDRRIDRFMDKNHSNGLPPFLCKENPGLRLGLMGGQFATTSLTAENRSLCSPLSIQTLTSTGDFQDIVSLGLVAARRAKEIYENTTYILAFELLCACQAVEIRGIEKLGSITKKVFQLVRKTVPYLSADEFLTEHLEKLSSLISSGEILEIEGILESLNF